VLYSPLSEKVMKIFFPFPTRPQQKPHFKNSEMRMENGENFSAVGDRIQNECIFGKERGTTISADLFENCWHSSFSPLALSIIKFKLNILDTVTEDAINEVLSGFRFRN
jgi:hypothetical protein